MWCLVPFGLESFFVFLSVSKTLKINIPYLTEYKALIIYHFTIIKIGLKVGLWRLIMVHQAKHIVDRYFPGCRRFEVGSHLIFG